MMVLKLVAINGASLPAGKDPEDNARNDHECCEDEDGNVKGFIDQTKPYNGEKDQENSDTDVTVPRRNL
jgi:hypothetical protein